LLAIATGQRTFVDDGSQEEDDSDKDMEGKK
jgi:hypothetical protein